MQEKSGRRLDHIAGALAARAPLLVEGCSTEGYFSDSSRQRACASVALVVRPGGSELELLVIKRATSAGDPWSGHMALPGGRRSAADGSSVATAMRETLEEVGVDLARDGRLLGQLDDVEPRSGAPAIVVSSFVFGVPEGATVRLNHEVALAMWVPVDHLAGPGSAAEYLHVHPGGVPLRFPAFGYQNHVIWGITHRIIAHFLEIAGVQPDQ